MHVSVIALFAVTLPVGQPSLARNRKSSLECSNICIFKCRAACRAAVACERSQGIVGVLPCRATIANYFERHYLCKMILKERNFAVWGESAAGEVRLTVAPSWHLLFGVRKERNKIERNQKTRTRRIDPGPRHEIRPHPFSPLPLPLLMPLFLDLTFGTGRVGSVLSIAFS